MREQRVACGSIFIKSREYCENNILINGEYMWYSNAVKSNTLNYGGIKWQIRKNYTDTKKRIY